MHATVLTEGTRLQSWYCEPCMVGIGVALTMPRCAMPDAPDRRQSPELDHTVFPIAADEAGRGSVCGPMVYAIAACPISYGARLSSEDDCGRCDPHSNSCTTTVDNVIRRRNTPCINNFNKISGQLLLFCSKYDDSKVLTSSQRQALFTKIVMDQMLDHNTVSISAKSISSSMLATSKITLNEMAAQATMSLIAGCLSKHMNVTMVRLAAYLLASSYITSGQEQAADLLLIWQQLLCKQGRCRYIAGILSHLYASIRLPDLPLICFIC